MNKEQTPISKYLASLERRQALLTPSPQPDSAAIIRKINFEDDTFFQGDQSILNVSPSPGPSDRQAFKRRRLSVLGEVFEDEENAKRMSDLERLLQQTQGELIEARAMNARLEHQISQIKRSNSERILGFEASENEMRSKMREATENTESLKEQANRFNKKEEELRAKLHQQTEAHNEKMSALETRLRSLESENLELKGKFESGVLKQSDDVRKLSVSLEETEMGAEKWVMETQLLRDQLELKEKQLQKYQNELKEAQGIICKYNEIKDRYEQPKSPDGSSESLEEKIKYFENLYVKQQTENIRLLQKFGKLSDENRMLRSSMDKEMLLEEQISTFEEEVKSLRKALDAKAPIEAERNTLHSDLSAWKNTAFKLDPDCTNPQKLEAFIRKIQNQLLEAKLENSTLKLTISNRDRAISKGQEELATLKDKVKSLTTEKDNLNLEVKKISRRLVLVTKDRDGLKELKESYEQEFENVISAALQDRINQLETTVAEYEAMVQEDPSDKKSCGECEKRIVLISELRTEMDRLKREKTEAEAQLANMSTVGAKDDDNTTGVKIVSFGLNPSALSLDARLKEAVKENEELKEKLKELQDQTVAGPSKVSDESIRELEDRNKTLERRLEIVSEAYDFETQQLQLIVNKLCGYHFTLVREPAVQIRLSSIYSQGQNDTFIFQESPNGDMLLLESPILDNFREDIDRFLLREGSIPGFLSYVTITYVQSQSTQDASNQLPMSQQSVSEDAPPSPPVIDNVREIEVEVQRQRRPTVSEPDDEDEEVEEDEEHEDMGEEQHEHDDEDLEGEGDQMDEEDEHYEEEEVEEEEEEHDEESEDEPESPPPRQRQPFMRGGPPNPARPPPGDESDDSDVIMID